MPTQKKGCDDDEIVGLFSPQRRLFRKSKAAVLFRAKVYKLQIDVHFARIRDDAHALIVGNLKVPVRGRVPYQPIAASRNSFESPSCAEYSAATVIAI